MAFDFTTLNDKDLEELVRDILSVELDIHFQSFKMGTDKGADLRYATNNSENEIIVQVKHYLDSGISKLKSDLKKTEAKKVIELNPNRYIFVTSLALTPKHKEDIKLIFSPYIISTNDVWGKSELNAFLRTNPDVVNVHFKLWLSSTNVLQRILNNGVKGRSNFYEDKIKDKIRLFVPNSTHVSAVNLLNKYNFVLITGAPGIGKSTLANMLTYQLLAEDFELLYVREITEAESSFIPNKKQVFLFDDFLGSITLDLNSSRNADSAIVQFIERIRGDKLKRLILTSRTTILNQAKVESDKISGGKVEISKYEIKFEDYKDLDKAKILYNHIYFSNLSDELKAVFFKDQFYWKVIKHSHYNPRIIEFFTDIERLQPGVDYAKEVMDFLDKPSMIWEKSFTKQISHNARLFLGTLYSLKGRYVTTENRIKDSLDARINYEVANHNYEKKNYVFANIIAELIGGFITKTITINDAYTRIEYNFLNPSIEDFLYEYFSSENIDEYFDILKASIDFDQFKRRITTKKDTSSKKIFFGGKNYTKLLKIFKEKMPYITDHFYNGDLNICFFCIKLFKWSDVSNIVIERMNNIQLSSLTWENREDLIEIMDYVSSNSLLDYFTLPLEEIFLNLAEGISSHFEIDALSKLLTRNESYSDFINSNRLQKSSFFSQFKELIDECWEREFDNFLSHSHNIHLITDKNDMIKLIDKRRELATNINLELQLPISSAIRTHKFDIDTAISNNLIALSEKETNIRSLETDNNTIDEPVAINRLFNSPDSDKFDVLPF